MKENINSGEIIPAKEVDFSKRFEKTKISYLDSVISKNVSKE